MNPKDIPDQPRKSLQRQINRWLKENPGAPSVEWIWEGFENSWRPDLGFVGYRVVGWVKASGPDPQVFAVFETKLDPEEQS